MKDEEAVIVRTSASAEDFWCRLRTNEAVSPDGRVKPPSCENRLGPALVAKQGDTPFGRQKRPFTYVVVPHPPPPPPSRVPSPVSFLKDSRGVQFHILRQEFSRLEIEHAKEQDVRARDTKHLRTEIQRAWKVVHVLVGDQKKTAAQL